jgi:PAS domain S-box-containing protein
MAQNAVHSARLVLSAVLCLVVFVVDLIVPLGVASGVPYVVPVFLACFQPRRYGPAAIAALATLLTVVAAYFSPPAPLLWMALANRGLTVAAIWVVAGLGTRQARLKADALLEVNERQAAQLRLSEEAAHLRAILATAPDAIIVICEEGRIEEFNPAAQEQFGYTLEEVIGKNVSMLMPDPARSEHDGYLSRYLQTGEAHIIGRGRDVVAVRKDGGEFPCRLAISEAVVKGGRRVFTGLVHDLSERQLKDEELRRRDREVQQLQRLEAVGQLASGLAHEYKNLLMGIQGCTSLAQEKIDAPGAVDLPAVRRYVDEIGAAARRGTSLSAQLLSFSRHQKVDLRGIEIDESVRSVERLLQSLLGGGVNLAVEYGAPDVTVMAGEGWIEQILLNLAVNARDAMPSGGRLSIRSGVAKAASGDEVYVVVKDSGTGMDAATRERVFEPFYTTKSSRKGTGLGLSTVHGLVQQMGGRIELVSDLGQGTTITVHLPSASAAEPVPDPEPEQATAAPAGSTTVLVVEDERLVLLTVSHYLSRGGYDVLLARSPLEALRICREREEPIDLLLSDVSLPEMGGRELAARVRDRFPTIAVLFMSAFTREQLLEEDRVDPDALTIEKPFAEEVLARRVAETLTPA